MAGTAPPRDRLSGPVTVAIALVPHFPLHALALCLDALRIANREALGTAFDWLLVGETGEPVPSSSGLETPVDLAVDQVGFVPVALVLAGYEPDRGATGRLLGWLRRLDRQRATIGCVDTGAILLARARLLDGATVCVHAQALPGLREDHPEVEASDRAFALKGRRLSSAGGVATLDMTLALIERHQGEALADRVARMMNHTRAASRALPGKPTPTRTAHPALARCVEHMQSHVEDPLSLDMLGTLVGVAPWTLRRLFRRHLRTTPADYYRTLRLERARQLLAYSHLSIAQIAAACGYADGESFSRAFSRRHGVPPSRSRHDAAGLPER